MLYAIGKDGVAKKELEDELVDLEPLFKTILDVVPSPKGNVEEPMRMLVNNIVHDEYVGRLALGRLERGKLAVGQRLKCIGESTTEEEKIGTLYGFEGLQRVKIDEAGAGDIVAVAGFDDVQIGDTLCDPLQADALPRIRWKSRRSRSRSASAPHPSLARSASGSPRGTSVSAC
ncbi:MAG: EF-Tu/IF-2/RF-3 family GTPase [Polyangiaceae bacterium]